MSTCQFYHLHFALVIIHTCCNQAAMYLNVAHDWKGVFSACVLGLSTDFEHGCPPKCFNPSLLCFSTSILPFLNFSPSKQKHKQPVPALCLFGFFQTVWPDTENAKHEFHWSMQIIFLTLSIVSCHCGRNHGPGNKCTAAERLGIVFYKENRQEDS